METTSPFLSMRSWLVSLTCLSVLFASLKLWAHLSKSSKTMTREWVTKVMDLTLTIGPFFWPDLPQSLSHQLLSIKLIVTFHFSGIKIGWTQWKLTMGIWVSVQNRSSITFYCTTCLMTSFSDLGHSLYHEASKLRSKMKTSCSKYALVSNHQSLTIPPKTNTSLKRVTKWQICISS